jgi:hypothetical protein
MSPTSGDSQTVSTPGDPVPGDSASSDGQVQPSADTAYLQHLHQSQSDTGATDDVLISDAHKVCTLFDSQKTLDQVFDTADFAALNAWQRGTMIGDSVANYCPQYSQTVIQQFEAQGGVVQPSYPVQSSYPTTAGGQGLPGWGPAVSLGHTAERRAWSFGRHHRW